MASKKIKELIQEAIDLLSSDNVTQDFIINATRLLEEAKENAINDLSDRILAVENLMKATNEKINYINNDRIINVLSLGIIQDKRNEETKQNNSDILKNAILNNSNVVFYFPVGDYFFKQIDIDTSKNLEIRLYGEDWKNRHISKSNPYLKAKVSIYTEGQGFINRTNETGNNQTTFHIDNISFYSNTLYDKKPTGICLGVTKNLLYEYNFKLNNVYIHGYEYGVYSPGYSCGGTGGKEVAFSHCKYGMYIKDASHGFNLENVDLLYCKYGIRLGVGGNPCRIKNVHVATGCFNGMTEYLEENPKMYGIHTKGGLEIDGIYYEQYSGELDVSNYTLIDYEGWGNGFVGKLIVKNSPIGCMGGGDKGYFFTGSNYVGAGAETGANNIICSGTYGSFSEGSVEFHNCVYGLTRNALIERIKKCFNMKYGIDRAYGYEFVGMTLIENGIAFAKHPIRKFKCPLRNAGTKNSDGTVARYDYNSTTAEGRVVDGLTFNNNPTSDNAENVRGVRYRGNIIIDNITNESVNVTLGIVGRNVSTSEIEVLREITTINKDIINKKIAIPVDFYVPKSEAIQVFFGYRCNNGEAGKLTYSDESKITYEITAYLDWEDTTQMGASGII